MLGFGKKKETAAAATASAPTPASLVASGTRFVVMPQKFFASANVPAPRKKLFSAKVIWALLVIVLGGMVGGVYLLLSSAQRAASPGVTPPAAVTETVAPTATVPESPVVEEEEVETPAATPEPTQPRLASSDTDADGLTDVEETIYATNPELPDSDADGYSDATEVANGYNPAGTGKLLDAAFLTYVNQGQSYAVAYPKQWSVAQGEQANELRLVINATEYVRVVVQSVASGEVGVSATSTIGLHRGVLSANGQQFTFTLPGRSTPIVVTYVVPAEKTSLDYMATIRAIIASIRPSS